jgi:hypothetical protein
MAGVGPAALVGVAATDGAVVAVAAGTGVAFGLLPPQALTLIMATATHSNLKLDLIRSGDLPWAPN